MGVGIGRRAILGMAGSGVAALAGCAGLRPSRTPPHGAVAVENDGDEPVDVAVTVTDDDTVLLDRRFSVEPGDLAATDQVIDRQGTYVVRVTIDDGSWERQVAFDREGPDGETIYGYILVYVTGPPVDVSVEGPPLGTA